VDAVNAAAEKGLSEPVTRRLSGGSQLAPSVANATQLSKQGSKEAKPTISPDALPTAGAIQRNLAGRRQLLARLETTLPCSKVLNTTHTGPQQHVLHDHVALAG
jgi:hypothetical protein